MAYNPFFYSSNFPQGYLPISNYQPSHGNSGLTWVQGIEGAKAYPVGAGNSVLLMDSDAQYMYIKTADNTGMPTLKVYEYKEVVENKTQAEPIDMGKYVTKKELEEALSKVKTKKKKIIEVEDDE